MGLAINRLQSATIGEKEKKSGVWKYFRGCVFVVRLFRKKNNKLFQNSEIMYIIMYQLSKWAQVDTYIHRNVAH